MCRGILNLICIFHNTQIVALSWRNRRRRRNDWHFQTFPKLRLVKSFPSYSSNGCYSLIRYCSSFKIVLEIRKKENLLESFIKKIKPQGKTLQLIVNRISIEPYPKLKAVMEEKRQSRGAPFLVSLFFFLQGKLSMVEKSGINWVKLDYTRYPGFRTINYSRDWWKKGKTKGGGKISGNVEQWRGRKGKTKREKSHFNLCFFSERGKGGAIIVENSPTGVVRDGISSWRKRFKIQIRRRMAISEEGLS